MRFSLILTSEQASILYGVAKSQQVAIEQKWSPGIYDGLLLSLMHIDRGGGALLRPSVLDYGGDLVEATIVPPYDSYVVWRGTKTVPRPYWDLAAMLPELSIREVVLAPATVYRATDPLAIIPLAPAIAPLLPLR